MAAPSYASRTLLSVIGDEDTVTGMLLAGTGHVDERGRRNFTIVDGSAWKRAPEQVRALMELPETETAEIERVFEEYTKRKDIAVLLISQHVADRIRYRVDSYTAAFPSLLEIPSKDHPYDPAKDSVMKRVQRLFGGE